MASDADLNAAPSDIAKSPTGDPYLLTPGPLTTSTSVKQAMLHDYGSRDVDFIELNRHICEQLLEIAHAGDSHVSACIFNRVLVYLPLYRQAKPATLLGRSCKNSIAQN